MNAGRILEDEDFYTGMLAQSLMPEGGSEYIANVSGWPRPIRGLLSANSGGNPPPPPNMGGQQPPPPSPEPSTPPPEATPETPEPAAPRAHYKARVYPYGNPLLVEMGQARVGPYSYKNLDDGTTVQGVGENTINSSRNPFQNLIGNYEDTTNYIDRWQGLKNQQFLENSLAASVIPFGSGTTADELAAFGFSGTGADDFVAGNYGVVNPFAGLLVGSDSEYITQPGEYANNPDMYNIMTNAGYVPNYETGYEAEKWDPDTGTQVRGTQFFDQGELVPEGYGFIPEKSLYTNNVMNSANAPQLYVYPDGSAELVSPDEIAAKGLLDVHYAPNSLASYQQPDFFDTMASKNPGAVPDDNWAELDADSARLLKYYTQYFPTGTQSGAATSETVAPTTFGLLP